MHTSKEEFYQPYAVMLGIYGIFLVFAFLSASPEELWEGLIKIVTSRSVLITDYIGIGGISAALINVVLVGCIGIFMLIRIKVKPNGATIMALWLTTGFSFFGKNIFNMIPITFGVWLYSKIQKEPFIRYYLIALLAATISPAVSEISFLNLWNRPLNIFFGILLGILCGFIFPAVSSFCVRAHDGYNLYNMGFTGGLISTFIMAMLNSIGIEVEPMSIWSQGNNQVLAMLLYIVSLFLIGCGILLGDSKKILPDLKNITKHSGRLASDFYILFGQTTYINMGVLCALATTILLFLGAGLNGPTLAGIFTIVGFGSFGKHVKNILPLMIGSIFGTFINQWDITSPTNTLAILFSTGLSPIAGQFGPFWGTVAGFLHVNFVSRVRYLNSGLNLYNNGYAAGFVALLLIPIISIFRKDRT